MTTTISTESSALIGGNKSSVAVLIVVNWAMFFGVLNASVVGVVLPTIADDLGINIG